MYDEITRVPSSCVALLALGGRKSTILSSLWTWVLLSWKWPEQNTPKQWKLSILPVFEEDASWTGREYVYAEQAKDLILTDTEFMTMVLLDWKLVHFLDEEEGQLFDLNNDPQEAINLWNEPDHQKTRQELLDNLLRVADPQSL